MITKIGEANMQSFVDNAKKLKNLPPDIQQTVDELCKDLPAQQQRVIENNKQTKEIFNNVAKKFEESAPKLDSKVTKFPTAAVGAAIGVPIGAALYLRHLYKKNKKKQ